MILLKSATLDEVSCLLLDSLTTNGLPSKSYRSMQQLPARHHHTISTNPKPLERFENLSTMILAE